MRKTLTMLSAIALFLSFSLTVPAADYDTVHVQKWDVSAVHDVMPAIVKDVAAAAPATIATYELRAVALMTDKPRVFRDFRTIADSGGDVRYI